MMTNRHAGEVLKIAIDEFAGAGIEMNCQLVMCRGVNDGGHLRKNPGKAGRPVPGGAQHRGRAHGPDTLPRRPVSVGAVRQERRL